jgi:tripartite-type tricarboxylate transporter receptor subunit TctC
MTKFAVCAVAVLMFVAGSAAWGQAPYPNKPVKLVLGFTPGSAADVVARLLAPKLADGLGQQVIVENKPGAGSNIAAESVVRSPADGYTLFLGSVANTINASLSKGLSFDFSKDLAPVAGVATLPNLLVVHPSVSARTVPELIAAAKAKPEGMMFGSSGNGTSPHLSGELFNLMAGVRLVHVPYKGSPQAVTDLLAGRVQVMFSPVSTVLQHVKAGTLKGIASTGLERASATPELPTIAESGLPGFETSVWFGLLAPAATPREIIERLSRETARVLAGADIKTQFAVQGIDTMSATPEQFADYVRQETAKWARVVQASGAKVD